MVSLVLINVIAFAIAYALTRGIKGSNLFRTVFFMPNLIGGIVLGYIWSMIFNGILIKYSTSVVLESKYGFWGLIILMCWQQIGYMMIIYVAGLQSVPEDMLEAARIDGANGWQTHDVRQLSVLKSALYSVIITVLSTALILLFTSMAAWYISRVNSVLCRVIYYLCVFSMVVPFQMVMFTLSKNGRYAEIKYAVDDSGHLSGLWRRTGRFHVHGLCEGHSAGH